MSCGAFDTEWRRGGVQWWRRRTLGGGVKSVLGHVAQIDAQIDARIECVCVCVCSYPLGSMYQY